MKLILIRHGEADRDQLTAKGAAAIEKLGDSLKKKILPGRILHSGKNRARQTAEILQAKWPDDVPLEENPYLRPESSPESILYEINDETEDLILVSHIPFLPNLMEKLGVHIIEFQPGTAVCLSPRWRIDWVL